MEPSLFAFSFKIFPLKPSTQLLQLGNVYGWLWFLELILRLRRPETAGGQINIICLLDDKLWLISVDVLASFVAYYYCVGTTAKSNKCKWTCTWILNYSAPDLTIATAYLSTIKRYEMLLGWYSLQLVVTHLLPRDCQEKDKPQIIRDVPPFVQTPPEDSSHMWVILSLSLKKTHVSIFLFIFRKANPFYTIELAFTIVCFFLHICIISFKNISLSFGVKKYFLVVSCPVPKEVCGTN